ncbi:hypothetical protein BayCH28_02585 [Mycolicibacterium sp. CH28]|uniref:hypothetical protein n=1 Tax=Mycolicibacterium sp. CH28 TaxID=2512237 RepID=UPI0010809C7F|nr:hypothetical protein [Mycolicibacterium sp. CH28]TGD90742.1 hypothetical protein BayCH28_02585 [Mycolicibacterium sp. CH28]
MTSPFLGARLTAVVGSAALIALVSLVSACGNSADEAPSSPSTSISVSPTEKAINPTEGNKFTPTMVAPPAPTMPAGTHHHGLNGLP